MPRVPVVLCILLSTAAARAESPDGDEVHWHWRDFQPAEHVASAVLFTSAMTLRFAVPWSNEPNLIGGVLADDWIYEHTYPTDESTRTAWNVVGDIPFFGSFVWSAADPLIAGIAHDWTVAGQMTLINLESHAVFSAMLWGTQYFVRRRRPSDRVCDGLPGPGRSDRCEEPNTVRAFVGGHTGMVATTASLTCLHHAYMPLFGGGVNDALPCAFWVAGTLVTLSSRTVTGSHYLSDNLLALGLGAFAGGLLPWALHYAHGPGPTSTRPGSPRTAHAEPTILPAETGEGAVMGFHGEW
jgi:hypothetical protein